VVAPTEPVLPLANARGLPDRSYRVDRSTASSARIGVSKPRPGPSISHIDTQAVFTLHCGRRHRPDYATVQPPSRTNCLLQEASPTDISIEACGSSHHWLGNSAPLAIPMRLIAPQSEALGEARQERTMNRAGFAGGSEP
jgi:hypothetical protein